jgi:quinol monooxygenase YgiN
MKQVTVVAIIEARPGKESDMKQVLLSFIEPTRKEAGCIAYHLHTNADQPGKFLFLETWASQAALDTHLKSPHMTKGFAQSKELSATAAEIKLWEQIA